MDKLKAEAVKRCMRCGTCCRKGGPVLHYEDMDILRHHHAEYAHLVTIRRGEPTFNPVTSAVEQAREEIVKVAGKGDAWECFYYREEDSSCSIYEHRFLECRLLKCWNPAEILRVIGRNTIRRSDVMNRDDPLLPFIERQEKECPLEDLKGLIDEALSGGRKRKVFTKLVRLMQKDAAIRFTAFRDVGLRPEYERFVFGRPVRNIVRDAGLTISTAA